jgi:multidrug efflux pump subunit AcrB
MRGPEEAVLRVALKSGSGIRIEELKHRLRELLPQRLGEWLRTQLLAEGLSEDKVAERVQGLRFSFEPADIVNEVMSFGSPTPIEVAVRGTNFAHNRAYASKVLEQLAKIPSLRDLQIVQPLEYPAVAVNVDRERAGMSGLTAADVTRSLVSATSSSRFVTPNFWADPKTGIGYQVQVQIPPYKMNSAEEINLVPIQGKNHHGGKREQLLVRDVARVRSDKVIGEYDRYNMQRFVSMTANIESEDLGHVAGLIGRALQTVNENLWIAGKNEQGKEGWKNEVSDEFKDGNDRPKSKPFDVTADVRGQVAPMQQMFGKLGGGKWFEGLTLGLGMSVVAIFLLLVAYFQSIRLALISLSAAPAVIAGVAVMLVATGTTLNIQSFMGAIMAVGVATANAILLVTFAEESRQSGASSTAAAVEGARSRLRAILMTACAMMIGMVPLALGIGEGGEQVAPLGRAVIGGLGAATLATLLIVPAVFALVQARAATATVSLDPDDPQSLYFNTERVANE